MQVPGGWVTPWLDTSFGDGGLVTTDVGGAQDYGEAVALGRADAIIVAGKADSGTVYDLALARYTSDGSLDPSFGTGGLIIVDFHGSGDTAEDVAIQPDDGRIVAGGYTGNGSDTEFALVRIGP